ncbi:MAG: hypothetical protein Q8922_03455 [Bacteroidota bacterium]|nr:hypothetical protein [Bacteroidota bacterium]MDP4233347.1 hypothetical protein [Bacteroidota bacterium]MDP4286970.1 hypothetical protein [Bacteroidota bacterium]
MIKPVEAGEDATGEGGAITAGGGNSIFGVGPLWLVTFLGARIVVLVESTWEVEDFWILGCWRSEILNHSDGTTRMSKKAAKRPTRVLNEKRMTCPLAIAEPDGSWRPQSRPAKSDQAVEI